MTDTSIVVPASHRSRWGYHVCDRATYLKLKALNRLVERVKRLAAAQWRWDRKTVNQGVRWEKVRDANGRVIGRNRIDGAVARPECPLSYTVITNLCGVAKATIGYNWVYELYRTAATPSQTPTAWEPHDQVPEAMSLLRILEAWSAKASA